MQRFRKILVAADTRLSAHPVVNAAAEIAIHNRSSLTILDVIPDFSWAARLTIQDHEHVRELLHNEKTEQLEALAAPIRDKGISVSTKLLEGKTSVAIIREVLRDEHDLVMSVAKSEKSRYPGFFGQTARRLLRNCPCAVWLVAAGATPKARHTLACIDSSTDDPVDAELNDRVFELASFLSEYQGSQWSVLHAWKMPDEEILRGKLSPQTIAMYEEDDRRLRHRLLNRFLQKHDVRPSAGNVHMIKGRTEEVIPNFVREHRVDLVVMGTVARSGLMGMLMGNTSEKILERLECSVLAVKPYRFKCPIRN